MVINGGSRSGAGELGSHLARVDTNERMEVRELRGLATDDMREGLRQMEGIAAGTRCRKSLYHVNINPGPNEAPLTPEQEARTIERLEQRLHLEGHPRVVVAHVKHGRAHLHVVWSRIDQATMRAVSDSHNYRAHEQVARELEREFGHAQVKGAHDRKGQERPPRASRSADLQQAARTKQDPARVTAEVSRLWRGADSGRAFATALEGAGYVLAQGDRRGFCILDQAGGVHSLARRIEGTTTKEVKARLAHIELAKLPTVDQARDLVRDRARVRESLALPVQERPAARLAGELVRPEAERDKRRIHQAAKQQEVVREREQFRRNPNSEAKAIWERYSDGRDFAAALQGAGYYLARGDEGGPRTFYTVDRAGRVAVLPEQVLPKTQGSYKEVGRRLAHLDIDRLPTIEQARNGEMPDLAQAERPKQEHGRGGGPPATLSNVKSERGKEARRTLGRGAGLLGTGLGKATGGLLGLFGRVLGAATASSSRQSESREDDTRRSPQHQAAPQPPRARAAAPTPAAARPTPPPAPPRRSVADELADRASSRPAESKPREPEPPRVRERERGAEFRPITRLMGALGRYAGWAIEAKKRLWAYGLRTGEDISAGLRELDEIIYFAGHGPKPS